MDGSSHLHTMDALLDLLIGGSYVVILLVLGCLFVCHRSFGNLPSGVVLMLITFAALLGCCGGTHIVCAFDSMQGGTIMVAVVCKSLTLLLSFATSAVLWIVLPGVLQLPSPFRLQALNEELSRHKEHLNEEVYERTKELVREKARWQHVVEKTPQILWLGRAKEVFIDYYNNKWYEYTGLSNKDHWRQAVHPDDLCALEEKLALSKGNEAAYDHKCRLRRGDGEYRWHLLKCDPIRDPETGAVIQWCGIASDVHDSVTQVGTRLLSMVSHEIRTPLNGILGMTAALSESCLPPKQAEKVRNISQCAEQLLALVANILELSRLQCQGTNEVNLTITNFNIHECVEDAMEPFGALANSKSIALTVIIHNKVPPYIDADSQCIKQVLHQLLSNAIKFTPNGGCVEVSVSVIGASHICVHVRDNGIGIAPSDLPKIFDMFVQADTSSTRKYGGLGLGLAISKALVLQMHGEIWCESALNAGTSLFFTFETCSLKSSGSMPPMYIAAPCKASLRVYDGLRGSSDSLKGSTNSLSGSSDSLRGPTDGMLPRFLLVDDTVMNQKVLCNMLKNLGYKDVELASDGLAAVKLVCGGAHYDIIFMDIEMPVMDGNTATKLIRQNKDIRKQPHIICVTANTFPDDIQKCKEAGMCGHIAKPVKKDQLRENIEYALNCCRCGC